ncbi:MAG: sigma-70 family RNA polymerase sigma factor [Bacteroidota bacterium]
MDRGELDKRAIERVKAGEQAAFRELIERYQDEAFSLAYSLLKEREWAEDVLQEAFIKAFDKIHSFSYQSSFYTWLYRIVVNRCYNELRKKRLTRLGLWEKGGGGEEAADLVYTNDRKQIVQAALDRMKPNEALVLRLFYLSELKIEEVVEVTGFSVSKVKVTLHRARKSFADIIKKHLGKEIEDL